MNILFFPFLLIFSLLFVSFNSNSSEKIFTFKLEFEYCSKFMGNKCSEGRESSIVGYYVKDYSVFKSMVADLCSQNSGVTCNSGGQTGYEFVYSALTPPYSNGGESYKYKAKIIYHQDYCPRDEFFNLPKVSSPKDYICNYNDSSSKYCLFKYSDIGLDTDSTDTTYFSVGAICTPADYPDDTGDGETGGGETGGGETGGGETGGGETGGGETGGGETGGGETGGGETGGGETGGGETGGGETGGGETGGGETGGGETGGGETGGGFDASWTDVKSFFNGKFSGLTSSIGGLETAIGKLEGENNGFDGTYSCQPGSSGCLIDSGLDVDLISDELNSKLHDSYSSVTSKEQELDQLTDDILSGTSDIGDYDGSPILDPLLSIIPSIGYRPCKDIKMLDGYSFTGGTTTGITIHCKHIEIVRSWVGYGLYIVTLILILMMFLRTEESN